MKHGDFQKQTVLVGGLVAIFYVPINIGILIIPIDELIFFRGVAKNHQPVLTFQRVVVEYDDWLTHHDDELPARIHPSTLLTLQRTPRSLQPKTLELKKKDGSKRGLPHWIAMFGYIPCKLPCICPIPNNAN